MTTGKCPRRSPSSSSDGCHYERRGLGNAEDLNLWEEMTASDQHGYLLDPVASKINWSHAIRQKDGKAIPKPPLPLDFAARAGSDPGELLASASCFLDKKYEWTIPAGGFADAKFGRYTTVASPYREWNTASYLRKADRELSDLQSARP